MLTKISETLSDSQNRQQPQRMEKVDPREHKEENVPAHVVLTSPSIKKGSLNPPLELGHLF